MASCHDTVEELDKYAPRMWKEDVDECETAIPSFFLIISYFPSVCASKSSTF